MAYSDVVDPVAMLNRAPEGHTGPQVADAIANAGFEVQAVNWVWQKIVGESLVDSIIKPITGDFDKIAEQAGQWKNVSAALQAVRNNLNDGLGELQRLGVQPHDAVHDRYQQGAQPGEPAGVPALVPGMPLYLRKVAGGPLQHPAVAV